MRLIILLMFMVSCSIQTEQTCQPDNGVKVTNKRGFPEITETVAVLAKRTYLFDGHEIVAFDICKHGFVYEANETKMGYWINNLILVRQDGINSNIARPLSCNEYKLPAGY